MSMEGAAPPTGPPMGEVKTGPDGEIIGGPRNMQQMAAQRRLQQTQAQVDEVVDIMKTNVDKVLERDHLLSELELRSDRLEDGASQFEKQAKSLKNKFWLENLKMIIVSGAIGLIFIGLIWYHYFGSSGSTETTTIIVAPTQPSVGHLSTVVPTTLPTSSSVSQKTS